MLTFRTRAKAAGIINCAVMLAIGCIGLFAQKSESGAAGAVAALSPPFQTVMYSGLTPKGATAPFFSHGYLIQFKHNSTFAGEPNIYLWNSSGQLEHEVAVWPAGTAKLFLTSVDVGEGMQLAFAGRSIKADGSASAFIATSGLDGASPKYFDTGNYCATQIAQADDGSIWSIGAENSENVQVAGVATLKKWSNYDVLRHYSSTGALIEHFLPRWGSGVAYLTSTTDSGGHVKFTEYDPQGIPLPKIAASWGYVEAWKTSRQAYLRTSGSQTVLFDGLSDRLCKHDAIAHTFSCERVTGAYANMMSLTGFALTSNGDVLASMRANDASINLLRGLFLLTPPKTSSQGMQWAIVPGTESSSPTVGDYYDLLGADGKSLVYRMQEGRRSPSTVYESTMKEVF